MRTKRFVYVSSEAAIGARQSPEILNGTSPFGLEDSGLRYAIAKCVAEELVLEAVGRGLDAVIVSPVETYGPEDDDFVTAGQIKGIIDSWPGIAVRGGASIVHVDDVADGIFRAFERGGAGERNILGGENLNSSRWWFE